MRKRTAPKGNRMPATRQTIAAASKNPGKVSKSPTTGNIDDDTDDDSDHAKADTTSASAKPSATSGAYSHVATPETAAASKSRNSSEQVDAIEFLKKQHRETEKLFTEFKAAQDDNKKRELARKITDALGAHFAIKEEIFYPAVREQVKEETLNRAQVERDAAKLLIQDLRAGDGRNDKYLTAKIHVLAEQMRHHMQEEERGYDSAFEQARRGGADLKALGQQLSRRADQLTEDHGEDYGDGGMDLTRIVSIRTQLQPRAGEGRRNQGGMAMATRDKTRNQGSYMQDEDFGGEGRSSSQRPSGQGYSQQGSHYNQGNQGGYGQSNQNRNQPYGRNNDQDYVSQQGYGYQGSQTGTFGSRGYGSESDFGARGNQGLHADSDYGAQGYDQPYGQYEGDNRNQSYGQASGNYRQAYGDNGERYQSRTSSGHGQNTAYGSDQEYRNAYGNDRNPSGSNRGGGNYGRSDDESAYGNQYDRNRSGQYQRDQDTDYGQGSGYGQGNYRNQGSGSGQGFTNNQNRNQGGDGQTPRLRQDNNERNRQGDTFARSQSNWRNDHDNDRDYGRSSDTTNRNRNRHNW